MNEFLTDLEKTKIEAFCADKDMFNAVKKVLLQSIYTHGTVGKGKIPNPLQNGAFALASVAMNNPIPDEQLGQHIRSMWAGVNALELGYNQLESIKLKQDEVDSPTNEAI